MHHHKNKKNFDRFFFFVSSRDCPLHPCCTDAITMMKETSGVVKRAARSQTTDDQQCDCEPPSADPYENIPPPLHPGHKGVEWGWHHSNNGPLCGSPSLDLN